MVCVYSEPHAPVPSEAERGISKRSPNAMWASSKAGLPAPYAAAGSDGFTNNARMIQPCSRTPARQ